MKWFCLKLLSSSSWGCELKYLTQRGVDKWSVSSSSWGCELKYHSSTALMPGYCHPLHEDVSWNHREVACTHQIFVILFMRMWVEIHSIISSLLSLPSSSSWGCELKFWNCWYVRCCHKSHPLHEDVSWNIHMYPSQQQEHGHPLHEDVSWNTISTG